MYGSIVIGCQLTTGGLTRKWEHWVELASTCPEWTFVFFSEKEFNKDYPQNVRNTAGKLNIKEFVHAISACDVFVCPDSVGMHIAPRLNIPVILLAGSTHVEYHTKYNKRWLIHPVYSNPRLPCSPCFDWQLHHDCYKRNNAPWCLNRIKPEQIIDKIKEISCG